MSAVPSRDLRNDTAGVLRRVAQGEEVVITVHGAAVARLLPMPTGRRRWMPSSELTARLRRASADPGLRDDLRRLAGETTEDLGPIR